jgi:hypothetical protein
LTALVPAIWKKITRGECRSRLMGHTYEAAGDQSTGIVQNELAGIVAQNQHEEAIKSQTGRFGVVRETFSRGKDWKMRGE